MELLVKIAREVVTGILGMPKDREVDNKRVQYFDEQGNNFMYERISEALRKDIGFAACKLGTIELSNIVAQLNQGKWKLADYWTLMRGYSVPIYRNKEITRLGNNAGFFPATKEMTDRFVELILNDIPEVDILASYFSVERYISERIAHCTKVNLDGYYAPFAYKYPWTRVLEGKRVLVIHPFVESIETQYGKRELLFGNTEVLPKFKSLRTIKAVQSIAGNKCEYADWFEALDWMKRQMEVEDFDVALVGCGAYGFPLTVHAKRLGRVGIHLAGWTQMLFGIYGKRWLEDQPQYAKFINDNWTRPVQNEVPSGATKVEGGCYW